MELVKRIHQVNIKSQQFRQQYTSQNTSRPSNSSRINDPKQKRFKRNNNNPNHSKSSSNCSQSSSISKFYVKNITKLLPTQLIQNQTSVKNIQQNNNKNKHKDNQRKQCKSPRNSIKAAFNSYGLNKQDISKHQVIQQKNQSYKNDSSIDVSNFLKRQFSPPPPIQSKVVQVQSLRNIKGGNAVQDSYAFLSPISKKGYVKQQSPKQSKDPKSLLQQLTKQRNKNAQLSLQLQKSKNNQKKLHLLNQQLDLKAKRLADKISTIEQQLNKTSMNNAKLKQQNHRMKVLVKQRDSLMTNLMQKDKTMKKQGSYLKTGQQKPNQSLVYKIIQFEYENQKLRDNIFKLKKQIQQNQYQTNGSRLLSPSQSSSHLYQPSISEITWDDRQFTDCLEQKDKQIIELRQQIKNLQIQINYINRKWANQIQRVKKIQKLQWMKLKDKYKQLLIKYKDNMKMNFVFPPSRDQLNRIRKQKKKIDNLSPLVQQQQNSTQNPQSPRRRKRNYTVQHLKGRGVMSDIRINYGMSKTGNPCDDTNDLELLQYSSCDQDFGI